MIIVMESVVVAVYNIPENFDTFSLREYFRFAIQNEYFECFHFKNRPENSLREILDSFETKVALINDSVRLAPPKDAEAPPKPSFDYDQHLGKPAAPKPALKPAYDMPTKAGFLKVNSNN